MRTFRAICQQERRLEREALVEADSDRDHLDACGLIGGAVDWYQEIRRNHPVPQCPGLLWSFADWRFTDEC